MYVFGYAKFLESSPATLKAWERRWPFAAYKEAPSFRASANTGPSNARNDTSSSSGGIMSFMGGGNASATSTQAPSGSTSRPQEEEKKDFKAFKGKGVSLGSDLEAGRSSGSKSK